MRVSMVAEAIRIAVHAILRRPVRSALGAATAAVAIATVVTTTALLEGSQIVLEHDLRALGALTVQVHADPDTAIRTGRIRTFDDADLRAVREAAGPLAEEVVPARIHQFAARGSEGRQALLPVVATSPGYLAMYEGEVTSGRWLNDEDLREVRSVAVLDAEAAWKLFGRTTDVLGERVSLVRGTERLEVEVIGVIRDPFSLREQFRQFDTSRGARHVIARLVTFENVHVPLELLPDRPYTALLARAGDRETAPRLKKAILGWSKGTADVGEGLFVWSRGEWIEMILDTMADFSLLGNVIWILVLLVAMVMIMAVTTVSVRERYYEVAVRRTEGATRGAILAQFTVEGVVVSLLGGLAGLGLGYVSAHVLAGLVDWPPAFAFGDILLAISMAVVVGLGSSALPARRAAKLDPVTVLSRRRL